MSDQTISRDVLAATRPFSDRHIGPDDHQVTEMLKALGVSSLEALMDDAVPGRIAADGLELPPAASERADGRGAARARRAEQPAGRR